MSEWGTIRGTHIQHYATALVEIFSSDSITVQKGAGLGIGNLGMIRKIHFMVF